MEISVILEISVRLFVAVILGGVLGMERTIVGRNAGLKTYSLVSLGSALFVLISLEMLPVFAEYSGFNPILMASQIIVGVGFLGAGMVIFQQSKVQGLTTAAGLWVRQDQTAAGFGLYIEALHRLLCLLIHYWKLEERLQELLDDRRLSIMTRNKEN
jgi:putative Mg2+ transporter-C (MgtC) family protein